MQQQHYLTSAPIGCEQYYSAIHKCNAGSEPELLPNQRLELAGKIARIDNQYSTVNLLNVAQKVSTQVQENASQ